MKPAYPSSKGPHFIPTLVQAAVNQHPSPLTTAYITVLPRYPHLSLADGTRTITDIIIIITIIIT